VQNYNYHWEIKDLLTQFLQAFDGAIVKRFNNTRQAGSAVAVRYVYAPKQRVLFDLVDKAQTITLPAVAFHISSISRDVSRVFNKIEGNYYPATINDNKEVHELQPVPVNITVNISIMTRFQTDMDQILSNFVPWSDPYFIISWTRDGLPYKEIRTEVLWDGNLRLGYPMDLNNNQPARVTCDTSFTIKGWLFKSDVSPVGRIYKIDSNFYAVSAIPQSESAYGNIYSILNALNGTEYNETVTVSARPFINYTDRWLTPTSLSGTCTLLGDMFDKVNAVYLSGSVPGMFGGGGTGPNPYGYVTLSAFSTIPSLSAKYPTLTGLVPALNYTTLTNNKMIVNYQAPIDAANGGFFDIILVNPAGYGILSKDTYIANSPIQFPYALSGIKVITVDPICIDWQNATFTWEGNVYTWLTTCNSP